MSEIEMLIEFLQERPNNAAVFATDDGEAGFMVQVLVEGDTQESEGLTIGDAIRQWRDKYEALKHD